MTFLVDLHIFGFDVTSFTDVVLDAVLIFLCIIMVQGFIVMISKSHNNQHFKKLLNLIGAFSIPSYLTSIDSDNFNSY